MILPDVLASDLVVVFCGTAAGNRSAQMGAYYAGIGNRLWPTLHQIGLTPRLLQPTEFWQALDYGIGLTDLANLRWAWIQRSRRRIMPRVIYEKRSKGISRNG